MKKVLFAALALMPSLLLADVYVDGYTRSDGTYVQGHYRSSPNSTTYDNYSTKGNTNPTQAKKAPKTPEIRTGYTSTANTEAACEIACGLLTADVTTLSNQSTRS